jgi:LacI family transcriptional regulator
MSSINLKRLSEELGLSISSVSKALRDSYEISAETKKRVLAMAEKLNYQPNPFASSLRRKKSITIAVVIPEIANNFFALAIDGIQMVAQQKGYHVLTYLTHENFTNEESTIKHLQGGRVDGVLISLCRDTDSIKHLTPCMIPVYRLFSLTVFLRSWIVLRSLPTITTVVSKQPNT